MRQKWKRFPNYQRCRARRQVLLCSLALGPPFKRPAHFRTHLLNYRKQPHLQQTSHVGRWSDLQR